MRQPIIFSSSVLAVLALASSAGAVTLYTSPTGTETSGCDARWKPCDLKSAGNIAVAGDTVILMDGTYTTGPLYITNSGTADAWITFEADKCATPIIEGTGVGPTDVDQTNGVHSETGTYLRFRGIVSRGWNTGFGNKWIDADSTASNGHWEFEYCIGDGNGRTGFTFFSAEGIKIKNSISAHNGSSTEKSWSSGITLLQAVGSENVVEGNISFENMDGQGESDGSGFIVDENSNGALFINNIAFGNGGSCLRLTRSTNTKFINNTCYHNAQYPNAMGPTNPSEIYFTSSDPQSNIGVTFMNNVLVSSGVAPRGNNVVINKPTDGWMNNVESIGAVTYLKDPDGMHPDFTPGAAATDLIGKGGTNALVPTNDLGFDVKCIVKRAPSLVGMIAKGPWWQYDIDLDYIKSIGGVEACFNAATRTSPVDMGAYKNGPVTTITPGSCVPPPVEMPPAGGMGGMPSGGSAGDGTLGGAPSAGGAPGVGGTVSVGGATNAGGMTAGGGMPGAGGTTSTGGTAGPATGGTTGAPGGSAGSGTTTGGSAPTGTGAGPSAGGTATGGATASGGSGTDEGDEKSGCGCRVAQSSDSKSLGAFGLVGLIALGLRRRRQR